MQARIHCSCPSQQPLSEMCMCVCVCSVEEISQPSLVRLTEHGRSALVLAFYQVTFLLSVCLLQTVFFSLQPSLSPAKTQQAALLDRPPFSWDGSLSLSLSQQYLLSAATFCQRAQLTVSPPAAAPCLPQAVYRCHSCLILNYSAGN